MAGRGSDSHPQLQAHLVFTKGTEVEVTSDEDGFKGSWYRATIFESPPKSSSRKRKQVLVQYNTVLTDRNASLKEYADPSLIRPLPPDDSGNTDRVFEENEVVDAAHRDGYWTGIVRKVLENSRYRVYFDNPTDVIEFSGTDLRPHWEWSNGTWIRPPKQQTAGSIYSSGESVEVKIEGKSVNVAWFPAVVIKEYGDDTFLVKYQSRKNGDESGMMRTIVDSAHIRPVPPCFVDRDYELLETVDIRYECGWRPAVVTKVLAGRKYGVFLNQGNEMKDLDHSEIRPHVDWDDGKWVSKSEKALIVSDIQEQFRIGLNGKVRTAKDNSDGKTPPVGIRNLTVKSAYSDEKLTGRNSAQGPLSAVEPSTYENLSKMIQNVGQSFVITGSRATGKRSRIKQHKLVEMEDEKLETMAKKARHNKSLVKSLQAIVTDKARKAVDVAGQDTNKNENELKETEISLILGLEATKMKNARQSYPLQLCGETTPKLLHNGEKSLNESAGDTIGKISQLAVGGSQRRKRGRPRKLVLSSETSEAGKVENDAGDDVNNLVLKDQIPNAVELPMQTATEPSASNGVAREKTIEVSETNCMTKEVDMAVNGISKDVTVDDDRPLSMWFGGTRSSKNGLSSGKPANGSSDAKERQIGVVAKGDVMLQRPENQCLPFTKKSGVWKTIESMEVFQLVPQNPHFAPLVECREEYREGMAIGFMVTFASLFEKIASLQFDSTRSLFEGIVESLLELAKHGFDITLPLSRVKEMLSIKDTQGELLNKSQSAEKELKEQSDEKTELIEKINAIEKKIKKLQEELTASKSKLKSKELQISSMRLNMDAMNKIINKARNDFEKIATAPWKLP